MSGHTKGEWIAKGHNVECVRDGIKVMLAHCSLMAVKYSDRRGYVEAIHKKRNKEVKANARLIAAAPKLLAACEAIVKDLKCFDLDEPESMGRGPCVVCQAKAAIESAKGD